MCNMSWDERKRCKASTSKDAAQVEADVFLQLKPSLDPLVDLFYEFIRLSAQNRGRSE